MSTSVTFHVNFSPDDSTGQGTSDTDASTGWNNNSATALVGKLGASSVSAGFRWDTSDEIIPDGLPQGAIIEAANLRIAKHIVDSNSLNLKIVGEDVDNPGIWDAGHRPGTGGSPGRGPETTAKVDWDGVLANSGFSTSPDISSIIQELVNRPGFGPHIAIILRNDGGTLLSTISTYDRAASTTFSAKLDVTYSPAPSSGQVMLWS